MGTSRQSGTLVGARLGKYELLALLALGGTAEIYLARIGGEAGFEKYVVVKCLLDHLADDEEFVRMFLDEARLGAQLDHSNIVQTLELGKHGNRYYMVMEYLAGMSLAQLARKTMERVTGGLMPVSLALGLGSQVCAGLHYAHQRSSQDGTRLNIVHRDISPQNLVVSFDGVLKIVDFGIAKADVRQTHTRSGTIKGKFAYMSPEQCLAKHVDRRTDIFALGVILHELLTGRRLFKRSTTYETYQAIVSGGVPTPSEVNHHLDPSMDEVVMTALSYDRESRYENAEAFGEALLHVLHKRGHAVSASDIRNYYEQHFQPELEDHTARMRALISGRTDKGTNTESLTWGGADQFRLTGDSPSQAPSAQTSDSQRPAQRSITLTTQDGQDSLGDGDDSAATRVELNPLDAIHRHESNSNPKSGAGEDEPEEQTGVRAVPQGKSDAEDSGKATVSLGPSDADRGATQNDSQPRASELRATGAREAATLSRVPDVPNTRRPTADPGEAAHRRSLSGAKDARRPTAPGTSAAASGQGAPTSAVAPNSRPLRFGPAPAIATSAGPSAAPSQAPPDTLPGDESIDEAPPSTRPAPRSLPAYANSQSLASPTQKGQGRITPPARSAAGPTASEAVTAPPAAPPAPGPFQDSPPAPALPAATRGPGGPAPQPRPNGSAAKPEHPAAQRPGALLRPSEPPRPIAAVPPDRARPSSAPPPAAVAPATAGLAPPNTDEVLPIPLSPGDDRLNLTAEAARPVPLWVILAAFVASVGVGMAATLFLGKLF